MTFNITKIPITSKLMLLQGGCTNFRSVGGEMIINFAESSSLLVAADANGAGKSSLFEHMPLYALTGRTSSKEDKVDALVNSVVGKGMSVFLIWHFAGTYYKVIRGRKPSIFDLYTLVNDEWIEIQKLPVSSKDRQDYMYSLLGLDRKTAVNVLENTVLLSGQRFKGFSSLNTPERRDLIEPILDLAIFSSLNSETKLLRSGVVTEQKQTYLEVTDASLKVSLSEQEVVYNKQDITTLSSSYNERMEVLNEKVSKCIANIKEASEVDTSGGELNEIHSKEHYSLCNDLLDLKHNLELDIESLGEFEIDINDKVLVKLNNDIASLDEDLNIAKTALEDKRKSLDGEVVEVIKTITKAIEEENINYNEKMSLQEKEHKAAVEVACDLVENNKEIVKLEEANYQECVLFHKQCEDNVELLTSQLADVLVKETQYKEKCDKLLEAAVYLNVKKEQEESNLDGLVHAGDCPTCKQNISADYLEGLKETLNVSISTLEADISIYKERITAGEGKVAELGIDYLREGLSTAELQRDQAILSEHNNKVDEVRYTLANSEASLRSLVEAIPTERLTHSHEMLLLQLKEKLSSAESKVKEVLGDLEVNYNHLVKTTPVSKDNLLQQIEDRKSAMRGEHKGKETNLKGVFEHAKSNIEYKIECLDAKLEYALKELVVDKEDKLVALNSSKYDLEEDIKSLSKGYTEKHKLLQDRYDVSLNKQFCKVTDLTTLNKKHDKQQQDIEDYNDLLLLLSDKEGKADIIKNYIPQLNKDVNNYLEALGMFINIEIDNEFNMVMNSEDRKGQSLYSLSAGQKSKLDLSILLSLRDLAASKESVSCNALILDEILEPFSAEALQDVILMLQERFKHNNIVLITQRGEEVKDLFECVKQYSLRGGFTVEIDSE